MNKLFKPIKNAPRGRSINTSAHPPCKKKFEISVLEKSKTKAKEKLKANSSINDDCRTRSFGYLSSAISFTTPVVVTEDTPALKI
ncbi:hypothetical protein D3C84_679720 [compost metagenome]